MLALTKEMEKLAQRAYEAHKEAFENWSEGKPVKVWYDEQNVLCVEYESGKWWHYLNLNQPVPTWW